MSVDEGALLRVCDLKTHFDVRRSAPNRAVGHRRAVDGVSLAIAGGSTLGLVGESGCGKTTLARSILRLIDVTSGDVCFDGIDVLGASGSQLRRVRRDMQLVSQDPFGSLNPRMPVGRIIAEPLDVHHVLPRRRRHERVAELLTMVGLPPSSANRFPHEFSGGQRQRIAIARAIALTPKLVICDEPVSALDVSVQSQILNLLADLREKLGMSYLFISHDLAVVRHVSDRVAVMYLGKIVEIADVRDLYDQPRHPYTMELLAAASWGPQPRAPATCMASETPDTADPPNGCAFHPRCRFAVEECRRVAPELRPMVDRPHGHLAACHRAEESLSRVQTTNTSARETGLTDR